MTSATHDTLVYRLAQILVKLNQGESLSPADLAAEFGVNLRTIQRDLNVRFGYLPLEKVGGRYRLDPVFLGKLSTKDIEKFASLAGVHGLFPTLSEEFLREIFDSRMHVALLVKGHNYENLAGAEETFRQLERAAVARKLVTFRYRRDKSTKLYEAVEPHKLVNQKGIWYLAAKDGERLKTFAFKGIESLLVLDESFDPDPRVEKTLSDQETIWFSESKVEVVLQVSPEVASYFRRRALIANQVIVKDLQDGGLILSTSVGHVNQILPIVRYWIPHIRIISPKEMRTDLQEGLRTYLRLADSSG